MKFQKKIQRRTPKYFCAKWYRFTQAGEQGPANINLISFNVIFLGYCPNQYVIWKQNLTAKSNFCESMWQGEKWKRQIAFPRTGKLFYNAFINQFCSTLFVSGKDKFIINFKINRFRDKNKAHKGERNWLFAKWSQVFYLKKHGIKMRKLCLASCLRESSNFRQFVIHARCCHSIKSFGPISILNDRRFLLWSHHRDLPPRCIILKYFVKLSLESISLLIKSGSPGCEFVGNKAKSRISKGVSQENKARQNFWKANISYPLICTRNFVFQRVRNVCFLKN